MRKSKLTKLLAVFLVFIFVIGVVPGSVFAAGETSASFRRTLEEVRELIDTIPYSEYLERYSDVSEGTRSFSIDATQYDSANTDANVSVETYDGVRALSIGEIGKVTWPVNISAEGKYHVEIEYYPVLGKASSIERTFSIDGKVPFSEARSLSMTKVWVDVYDGDFGVFRQDVNGNDIRPSKVEAPEWRTYTMIDSTGFFVDPFEFYFTAGDHLIALEAVREPMAIASINIVPVAHAPAYADYLAAAISAGAKEPNVEPIKIPAETPAATSEQVIYPLNDRSSAITEPQDPSLIRLNTIGNKKWQTVGQWIRYEIDVPEAGLYNIIPRSRQAVLAGMFSSRKIRINGETPFAEANFLQFPYNDRWSTRPLNNGETDFLFYLEKGVNAIEFEVALGDFAVILSRVTEIVETLNKCYLQIMKITGVSPDRYRDYNFARLIPEVIIAMADAANALEEVSEELYLITGNRGEHVATLNTVAQLVERMATDEDEVAGNLGNLKNRLGTLGTWLYTSREQAVDFDYIVVQPASAALPKPNANFFQSAWFEISSFVLSFFSDYETIGATAANAGEGEAVTMWFMDGRDQAQILRQLIDYEFTAESGIPVTLKLVAGGSVLPSILAGVGPDVTFLSSGDTINYAIRSAVLPVDQFADYEEVTKRFPEAAMVPLILHGDTDSTAYGLPSTMLFNMMFYRMDVFADLGIDLPETWIDLYKILPILQNNKMEIAYPKEYAGTIQTVYQMGGELYAENGKRINLDSNVGLTAFATLTDLFQKYKFPVTYDFATRFRTGEMPLGVVGYNTYNTLIIYASEIRDIWEMVPLFGWKMDDGTVNNTSPATVSAIVMPRGAKNLDKAWELMKWFTSAGAQARYANELVAVLGPAGKYNTANVEALAELPWTANEYRALEAQMQNLAAVPEYPGGYIIERYVRFAFNEVYNDNRDPIEAMLNRIIEINKELTRKRKEFDMEYLEISYSSNFIESAE